MFFPNKLTLLILMATWPSWLAGPCGTVHAETSTEANTKETADPEATGTQPLSGVSPETALVLAGYDPKSINMDAQESPPSDVKDEILLADGDVIRGTITSETDDEIVITHPVFQELRIPRGRIVAIKRSAPPRRRPGFGEVITGAGVRPPVVQPQTTSGQTDQSSTAPPTQTPAEAPAESQTDLDKRTPEALTQPDTWSFVLGTAFGYVQNVNDEINIRLSAQAEHQSEFARLRIDSAYFFNSSNNVVIDNDVIVTTTQDWLLPDSNWSIFAKGSYQWDDFEVWEHRLSGYIGPGYQLVNSPTLVLDLRVGAGATYEYGVPQILPEALVSFEWAWEIDDRQKFNGIFSYAPDITDINQYRLSLNAEWNFRLQKEDGLSFYIGVREDFQSIVPSDSTNNDLRVFGGIKYEF